MNCNSESISLKPQSTISNVTSCHLNQLSFNYLDLEGNLIFLNRPADMSKRRSIHRRKSDTKNSSPGTNTIPPPPLGSDPTDCDVPNSIKFLRSFERILEPTLYTKPISVAYFSFSVTLLLSLLATYFPSVREYAVAKDNFLNVYFVKKGWGWILLVVGAYVLYSSCIYTLMELKLIIKHMGRLIVSTALWFLFTNIFDLIQEASGVCTNKDFTTPKTCVGEGFIWTGFDISGHCFLLSFGLLIIVEEFKTSKFVYWDSLAASFVNQNNNNNKLSTLLFEHSQLVVMFLKLAALVLLFIWQWMLITSALFYHTFSECMIGTICGIVSWWSTYVLCFHPQKYLTYPGDGYLGGHFKEYSDLK